MDAVRATDVGLVSHFIRGANIDSPQTVLCTLPQLFGRGKFSIVFDATRPMRVAQNTQVDRGG